jgi:hypothetical protein
MQSKEDDESMYTKENDGYFHDLGSVWVDGCTWMGDGHRCFCGFQLVTRWMARP